MRELIVWTEVELIDAKWGMYAGRVVAPVMLVDGSDLALELIGARLGLPYDGKTRPDWCAHLASSAD